MPFCMPFSLLGRPTEAIKLDYCNVLLFNVTDMEISKVQGVETCLTRVVTKFFSFLSINSSSIIIRLISCLFEELNYVYCPTRL